MDITKNAEEIPFPIKGHKIRINIIGKCFSKTYSEENYRGEVQLFTKSRSISDLKAKTQIASFKFFDQ